MSGRLDEGIAQQGGVANLQATVDAGFIEFPAVDQRTYFEFTVDIFGPNPGRDDFASITPLEQAVIGVTLSIDTDGHVHFHVGGDYVERAQQIMALTKH